MNNKKNKNMFDEIVSDIPKAQKAAKNAQNMRHKQMKENANEANFVISKKISKKCKGLPRTFYLHDQQVNKIKYWKKKGYPLSEIIRYLIDNAPEEF